MRRPVFKKSGVSRLRRGCGASRGRRPPVRAGLARTARRRGPTTSSPPWPRQTWACAPPAGRRPSRRALAGHAPTRRPPGSAP
eukprot:2168435-Prymnesium_polylepis.1